VNSLRKCFSVGSSIAKYITEENVIKNRIMVELEEEMAHSKS
jgi:hypothetical protein